MSDARKMDIKKQLQKLLDSKNDSIGSSYVRFQKLVMNFLDEYLKKQGKELITNHEGENRFFSYDGYVPTGFDDFAGSVRIEIQAVSQKRITIKSLESLIPGFGWFNNDFEYFLLIIPRILTETIRTEMNNLIIDYKLVIWGIDELVDLFNKEYDIYEYIYRNLDLKLIESIISTEEYLNNFNSTVYKTECIGALKDEYKRDNLTLFLGAGVSSSAGIVAWDELISGLYIDLIDTGKNKSAKLADEDKIKIVEEMKKKSDSPLIHARIIKTGLSDSFEDKIAEKLYGINIKKGKDNGLLGELARLCAPPRGKEGVKAVITYNFDDLLEKALDQLGVKYCSVYCDEIMPDEKELGIFHVHGFLPQNREDYERVESSLLVFSENAYHKLMLEPYHWANITQLNYLINHTCLFVGLSMSDPNLRRLLEVAGQKRKEIGPRHYAIEKYEKFQCGESSINIRRFEQVYKKMLEQNYESLGVKVIWVDDYDEIPNIISEIRG